MLIMIKKRLWSLLLLVLTLILAGVFNQHPQSASLTSVSVTSSNPRPSFRGALAAGNTEGTSQIIINTTPNAYPSTSSAQLVEGDILRIGSAGDLGSYTVASTSSLSTIYLKSALGVGHADEDDDVIASTSATQTVRFTTASALSEGRFRVLFPSLSDDNAAADGIPDGGYYDFGTSAPTVTCPTDISNYDFVSGTATASTITIDSTDYHSFECAYSGTGAVGTSFSANPLTITSLINPAPKTNHTTGIADTHPIILQHLDSSFNVVDQTAIQTGVIEAVKITATVPSQITFQVIGVSSGTSTCGITTDVTTTAASVPFGEISISDFTNAAQALTVSTNAVGGFVVTGSENDQLGRNGAACAGVNGSGIDTCIPDAEVASMDSTTEQTWTSASYKGFAFALHDINDSTTEAFSYNSPGAYSARHFADIADGETAATIFESAGVADNQNLYVCYRIIAESTTAAGNYENNVTYNATATF